MAAVLLVSGLFACGMTACGPTPEERLEEIVAVSEVCEAGDVCVLAGFGRCGCGVPVREETAMDVDQVASEGDSFEWLTGCPASDCNDAEPTCVDNLCVQAAE